MQVQKSNDVAIGVISFLELTFFDHFCYTNWWIDMVLCTCTICYYYYPLDHHIFASIVREIVERFARQWGEGDLWGRGSVNRGSFGAVGGGRALELRGSVVPGLPTTLGCAMGRRIPTSTIAPSVRCTLQTRRSISSCTQRGYRRGNRIQNSKDRQNCHDGGGRGKDRHVRQIGDVAESLLQAGRQLQELQEQSL